MMKSIFVDNLVTILLRPGVFARLGAIAICVHALCCAKADAGLDLQGVQFGDVSPGGATQLLEDGGVRLSGAGNLIGDRPDQYYFAYQTLTGDFDVRVRIASFQAENPWANAGLILRESLDAETEFGGVVATPGINGCYFLEQRSVLPAARKEGGFPNNYPNTWLRLKREGNAITGFASLDGAQWRFLGATSFNFPEETFLGLAVASGETAAEAQAVFYDFGTTNETGAPETPIQFEPPGPSSRRTGWVISEIMYHPPETEEEAAGLEYVELFNSEPIAGDLSRFRLDGDIEFQFPEGTVVPPGGFILVAQSADALKSLHAGAAIVGDFEGELSNDNGRLRLLNRSGAALLEIQYDDASPWPASADGAGHSLALVRPSWGEGHPNAWAASAVKGGSPGRWESVASDPIHGVVINEILAATSLPEVDYIELYNHANREIDLSGAVLSDDPVVSKYIIPEGTAIAAGGYRVFDQNALGFNLDGSGETVFLSNANNDRVIDALHYGPQEPGVALGRFPDGGPFHKLSSHSPGGPNAGLLTESVVINEIMYHPISGRDEAEYIELHNLAGAERDLSGWRFIDGVDFEFPEGSTIAANGYLVVARNRDYLLEHNANLSPESVVGDYSGVLSNEGERLILAKPISNAAGEILLTVADEAAYVEGERWGIWADGDGSSLELIDPRSDNRIASNWAGSNETEKADWISFEHTGVLDNGLNAANEVQIMLLGAGECLVDDVEVFLEDGPNLVPDPSFEDRSPEWVIQGNHVRSQIELEKGFEGSHGLHIRASGGGDNGANRIESDLDSSLPVGSTATIRGKVRWLAGHTNLLVRIKGNYLEAVASMNAPGNLGTPGQRNSRFLENAGPAIHEVAHYPVLPGDMQAVTVTARAPDPDGTAQVTLNFRPDNSPAGETMPMRDDGMEGDRIAGDGIYTAVLPPQPQNLLMTFHVTAQDAITDSPVTEYPLQGEQNPALIRYGSVTPFGNLGAYRIWMRGVEAREFLRREQLSNEPLPCTIVYGNFRAIHGGGARYRGSPFLRPQYTSGPFRGAPTAFLLKLPKDDPMLGADEFNLDTLEPDRDTTRIREKTSFWIADQLDLPFCHQRYVHVLFNGVRRGLIYADVQQPNRDFFKSWFPGDADGEIFKIDDWFEFDDGLNREFNMNARLGDYRTTDGRKKQARYRWSWEKKSNGGLDDDYSSLFQLVDAVNAQGGGYTQAVESLVDVEQWMGIFGVRHIVADWDGYGYQRGKNQFTYKPQNDRWKMILWDLDFSLGGGSDSPTTSMLSVDDPVIFNMYTHGPFARLYWQLFHRAANGPLAPGNVNAHIDAWHQALRDNQLAVTDPRSVKSWIAERRSFILNELGFLDFEFELLQGDTITTNQNLLELNGTAPLSLKSILVNGTPRSIRWDSEFAWSIRLVLTEQDNALIIQGIDYEGNLIPSAVANVNVQFTGDPAGPEDRLIINEIMYRHPMEGADFIEIHNASPNAFDLTNYRLAGVDFDFPAETIIEGGQYLVLASDRNVFSSLYGPDIPVAGEFAGNLNDLGEALRLITLDEEGNELAPIDEVTYSNAPPWPELADGLGASLQLIDAGEDNNRPANWAAVPPPSAEGPQWTQAAITGVAQSRQLLLYHAQEPQSNLIVNGDFETGDFQGWTTLDQGAGAWEINIATFVPQSPDGALPPFEGEFSAITDPVGGSVRQLFQDIAIPDIPKNINLAFAYRLRNHAEEYVSPDQQFRVEIRNPASNALLRTVFATGPRTPLFTDWLEHSSSLNDFKGQTVRVSFTEQDSLFFFNAHVDAVRVEVPGLSEVFIDNLSLVAGSVAELGDNLIPDGGFESALDSGWSLADNMAGTAISTVASHQGGSSLRLVAAGAGGDVSNSLARIVPLEIGETYTLSFWYLPTTSAREVFIGLEDGSVAGTRDTLPPPPLAQYSPGAPNPVRRDLPAFPDLWINEIALSPGPWIELYNAGQEALDLTLYRLTSDLSDLESWSFPPGRLIQPAESLLVSLDGSSEPAEGPDLHANFTLDPSAGVVALSRLVDAQSQIVDHLFYGAIPDGYSLGLFPNGLKSSVRFFPDPTPGLSNDFETAAVDVAVNEWMASNQNYLSDPSDGNFDDWFELYNAGDQTVDLTGFSLTDDADDPRRFVIPPGYQIGPKGFLLVWADNNDDPLLNDGAGDLHVNFRLNLDGELIGLYAPDGSSVDLVEFGPQTDDESEGLAEDGDRENRIRFISPTPGAGNTREPPIQNDLRFISVNLLEDGRVELIWNSIPGKMYEVYSTDALSPAQWSVIASTTATQTTTSVMDNRGASSPQRYYRILAVD